MVDDTVSKTNVNKSMIDTPIGQHGIEIERNRKFWDQKPVLREIYQDFYRQISRALASSDGTNVLELGSGIGAIKSILPHCTTSDIFPNPWLDRTENAYDIKAADASLSGLILFDVWHHLEFPGSALKEFARVLRPGGRVVLFEPAMGLIGRGIYGLFHHEPLAMNDSITWNPPAEEPFPVRYYAAQGNCWRAFYKRQIPDDCLINFSIREVATYSALAYAASGGFSKPQCYPDAALRWIRNLESLTTWWPWFFATRMMVCLERMPTGSRG